MTTAAPARTRIRLPGLALAALALLVLGVSTTAPTLSTYLAQQRRIADVEATIAQQKADLADLAEQRARWNDPAYVRAQAGSRLYYVMPGTTAYRVVGTTAKDASASTPAAVVQPDAGTWPDRLLGSLIGAGTTDRPTAAGDR